MPSHSLAYALGIVFNRIVPANVFRFRRFVVYELELPASQHGGATAASGLTIVRCDSASDRRLAESISRTEFSPQDPQRDQHTYWLAKTDLSPVGGLWVAQKSFDEIELGIRIVLPPRSGWIFSAYVDKSHRQSGVYGRLLATVLSDAEINPAFAAINPVNRASMAAHRHFVRRTVGYCTAFRVGPIAFCSARGDLIVDKFCSRRSREHPILVRLPGGTDST
ncbi:MAG: hypothetical protein HKN47_13370 [Pirellulaceae bacterium]|nr:hypothetical protein [Pirellulaceae bacterium]